MITRVLSGSAVSRRHLLRASVAGAALLPLAHLPLTVGAAPLPSSTSGVVAALSPGAASPATWHTWLLTTADELRPAAPTDPTPEELAELVQLQAERDDATIALIKQWNSRPAVLPWTELANTAFEEFGMPAMRQSRAQGLLQTAMYDAVVASWDAQEAYSSPVPSTIDNQITPLDGIAADRPAYPSAEAAVAGAAATVLIALLPDGAPARYTALHPFSVLADEAAMTRLMAGLNTRRDIEAGLALGRAIGERALAHGADDQPGTAWDGSGRLEGEGFWVPTPPAFVETPLEPLGPTWKPWVLERADTFRPAPPPAYASPGWQSQLAAVQAAVAGRSFAQAQKAKDWQGTAASTLWNGFASELIVRDGLELPQAARVLALLAVAQADAQLACWDGKYTFWTERPITADPELDVLFPTPPFPSYPSGHSTVSNAAAVVLAQLFPDDATDLLDLAEEAAASRCWAGIHYPIDDDAGTVLGRNVGYLVTAVAATPPGPRIVFPSKEG